VVPTVLVRGVDQGFAEVGDLGGTESVVLSIVPEPATFALLMIGGLATLRRRRKMA